MSRRLSVALGAAVSVVVLVASASAKEINGTPKDDTLIGTPQADTIRGLAGSDRITGRKGDDWAFGNAGNDEFFWTNGDGHDRIDGGSDENFLFVTAGRNLRLHLDAQGAGPEVAAKGGQQVIGVRGMTRIEITGDDRGDTFVLSSDRNVVGRDSNFNLLVRTGSGTDRIDARGMQARHALYAGGGRDAIWTAEGGSFVQGGSNDDVIRLGKGPNTVSFDLEAPDVGHDTVYGFGADDTIEVAEPAPYCSGPARYLDTNGDGQLTAKDKSVRVKGNSMTINLSLGTLSQKAGNVTVTLVGRTSVSVSRVIVAVDC